MKLERNYIYDPEQEPAEASEWPLCDFVLESREEVIEVIDALIPPWAWVEKLEFKHRCQLAGRCKRVYEDGLTTEGFILTFYGKVFLTTVLHEIAHIADLCRHGHDEEFKAHFRTIIKEAKKKFQLDQPGMPLLRTESRLMRSRPRSRVRGRV
jgi:hypothetical protein